MWFKNDALPRRLAIMYIILPASRKGYRVDTVPHSVSQLPGQLEKERPESKPGNILFRTLPTLSHNEGVLHPQRVVVILAVLCAFSSDIGGLVCLNGNVACLFHLFQSAVSKN